VRRWEYGCSEADGSRVHPVFAERIASWLVDGQYQLKEHKSVGDDDGAVKRHRSQLHWRLLGQYFLAGHDDGGGVPGTAICY